MDFPGRSSLAGDGNNGRHEDIRCNTCVLGEADIPTRILLLGLERGPTGGQPQAAHLLYAYPCMCDGVV